MPISTTNNRRNSPITKAERAQAEPAKRLTAGAVTTRRHPSVMRVPGASERLATTTVDVLEIAAQKLSDAPKTTMRFLQFVKAYIRGFAAAAGTFFLLSELVDGHFNVFRMLGTHLFMIMLAPVYAIGLAPVVFGIYSWTIVLPVRQEFRIYAMGIGFGALLIVPGVMRMISDPGPRALSTLISGVIILASALIGGWTFNRAAAKLRARDV